jgi:mannose-6-phosphate isomerase-like protein (cupin superfamily)
MTELRPSRGYTADAHQGLPGQVPGVVATRASTNGALTVIRSEIRDGPPLHTHRDEDETLYVLAGTLTVRCGDDTFHAGPGSFVFLPRNLPHTFNSTKPPATVLLIAAPGGLDEYFRELRHAASDYEIERIQQRFGIMQPTRPVTARPRRGDLTGGRVPLS